MPSGPDSVSLSDSDGAVFHHGTKGKPNFRNKPLPSLYFMCRFCNFSMNSIPKVKEHIQKQHKVVDVTTEHYLPAFRKDTLPVPDGSTLAVSRQFEFECIICNTMYSTKDSIVFHVKNSHVSDLKLDSCEQKKVVFKPPLKNYLVGKVIESNSSIPTNQITPNDSQSCSKKFTKSSPKKKARIKNNEVKKINYYKELNNVLVDKNKTNKLNLWGAFSFKENYISTAPDRDTLGLNQDSQNSIESNVVKKSDTGDMDMITSATDTEHMPAHCVDLVITSPNSTSECNNEKKRGRRPKLFHVKSGIKKGRFFCGFNDCAPCSITVDCGKCDECLNKKTKK